MTSNLATIAQSGKNLEVCIIPRILKLFFSHRNLNVTLNKELNALDVHLYKKKVCSDNFVINFVIKLGNNEFQWEKKASELDINWGWPCLMRLDVLFDESKGYIDSSRRLKLFIEMKLTEIDATAQLDDSIASVGYVCETCSYYFENQAYSDLTLICCDDVALPIHRVFLAKKSPVFKKLFDAEMHENKITLQDIKAETMKEVLRFIYCGTTDVDEVVMTTNVLYAAAQYEIADLIDLCIDGLMKKIDKDNVMAILDIAVAFNHEDLEKKCLDIILK